MRQMLNTLYVTTGDAYLSLDGETIVLTQDGDVLKRYPLLNFESIIKFGHMGVSPVLLGIVLSTISLFVSYLDMVVFLPASLVNTGEMLCCESNSIEYPTMRPDR